MQQNTGDDITVRDKVLFSVHNCNTEQPDAINDRAAVIPATFPLLQPLFRLPPSTTTAVNKANQPVTTTVRLLLSISRLVDWDPLLFLGFSEPEPNRGTFPLCADGSFYHHQMKPAVLLHSADCVRRNVIASSVMRKNGGSKV